jgi:hypothetical protein
MNGVHIPSVVREQLIILSCQELKKLKMSLHVQFGEV